MPLNFVHKYSNVHCISNSLIFLLHQEDRHGWLIMSDTSSAVSLLAEFTYLQCFTGLSLADPRLYAVSDLGNLFLCLVYCTWTWFLTQIVHLLNSILCIKVCYAQQSVCMCNTGACLLWETCKYLLVCNVLAALYTTVADCNVSDYNRQYWKNSAM